MSTYLPGAWSDDLTSDGAAYGAINQEKSVDTLLAGNGGSSGTVAEPTADADRFPFASIWAYQADGSTLGEAFYKAMQNPDLIQFIGDLLSQAYADVPAVTFTTAPANGSTVSGSVSITASATLNKPTYATGISHLELFADGLDTGATVTGGSGTLAWDSTQATDGIHELRVVAYNNSQAASEGFKLVNVVVNNSGESVGITGPGSYNIAWNAPLAIPVSATQGTGPAMLERAAPVARPRPRHGFRVQRQHDVQREPARVWGQYDHAGGEPRLGQAGVRRADHDQPPIPRVGWTRGDAGSQPESRLRLLLLSRRGGQHARDDELQRQAGLHSSLPQLLDRAQQHHTVGD